MQKEELQTLKEELVQRWNQFDHCTLIEVSIVNIRIEKEQKKVSDCFKTFVRRLDKALEDFKTDLAKLISLDELIPPSELEKAKKALSHVEVNLWRELSDECKQKMREVRKFLETLSPK